jgi:hypothetical protein
MSSIVERLLSKGMESPDDSVIGHLVISEENVRLFDCPVGLFMYGGELCVKTQYKTFPKNYIDAFIVSSGEFFSGGVGTVKEQYDIKVKPVTFNRN